MDRNGKQSGGESRFATVRQRVRDGVKWWAEHQAWPATEEIRIEPKQLRF